jgi:imidazolonepropionase
MTPMWDLLIVNGHLATMTPDRPYGSLTDGAIGVVGGRIAWVGPRSDLPTGAERHSAEVVDAHGGWVTPGLVDCHTHLVWGGSRVEEFEARLTGATYEEIARRGGGILSTVKATREAPADGLRDAALTRLDRLLAEGVTVIEIKSGYGLDTPTELKMLRVARSLAEARPLTVRTTFLGAHAVPPEYAETPDQYVNLVCDEMLPEVAAAGLADAVDAFCERIAFTPQQVERIFRRARDLGLPVKLHAEQLSDSHGAALAARFDALSADHLEWVSEEGVEAMASAGSVAVLLPGAYYVLRDTHRPPVDRFRARGVPMALSTDCNPGSSPVVSLLLMLSMGCTLFGLTPSEALAGVTREGARALGMADSHGTIEPGKVADLVVWEVERPAELAYMVGANPCRTVIRGGGVIGGT